MTKTSKGVCPENLGIDSNFGDRLQKKVKKPLRIDSQNFEKTCILTIKNAGESIPALEYGIRGQTSFMEVESVPKIGDRHVCTADDRSNTQLRCCVLRLTVRVCTLIQKAFHTPALDLGVSHG